jgi:hypothetical protein
MVRLKKADYQDKRHIALVRPRSRAPMHRIWTHWRELKRVQQQNLHIGRGALPAGAAPETGL